MMCSMIKVDSQVGIIHKSIQICRLDLVFRFAGSLMLV